MNTKDLLPANLQIAAPQVLVDNPDGEVLLSERLIQEL